MTWLASIPSPSTNALELGPLTLRVYGLMYVLAVLAAVWITRRRWVEEGGSPTLAADVAIWGFPAGLIGGRLYFVITSWDEVPDAWWGPFAVWEGGLGLWGGIAGGVLVGVWYLRRQGVDVRRFLDAAVPGLLVAQAIGRVGNWFNQELFGGPTTLPWGLEIAPAFRPEAFVDAATFHPVFLYEIVWDLLLAVALVALGRTGRIRPMGLFALYVAGYCVMRTGVELLRIDPAHVILGQRLNFWVALIGVAAGLLWFWRIQRGGRTPRGTARTADAPAASQASG